jgi:hypothetical protein
MAASSASINPYFRLKKLGVFHTAGTKKGPSVRLATSLERRRARLATLNEKQPILSLRCACVRSCFETFCAVDLKVLREQFHEIHRADERKEYLKKLLRPPELIEGQYAKKLEIHGSRVCTTAVKLLFGISCTLVNCLKATPGSEQVGFSTVFHRSSSFFAILLILRATCFHF